MRRQEQRLKAARAEEAPDTDASLASWRKNFKGIDTAFLHGCLTWSESAWQQKPSRRFTIVAKHDVKNEFNQRRLAEVHFAEFDFRCGPGSFRLSKILYQ